jgi:hypothetical protein
MASDAGPDVALVDDDHDDAAAADALVGADHAVGSRGRSGRGLLFHGLGYEVGGDHPPRIAVHGDREVVHAEAANGTALLVHDVDVHRHHVHVGAEYGTRGGRGTGGRGGEGGADGADGASAGGAAGKDAATRTKAEAHAIAIRARRDVRMRVMAGPP